MKLWLLLSVAAFGNDFFEARVRPVLVEKCGSCHGENAASGLRLDSREGLLKPIGPSLIQGAAQRVIDSFWKKFREALPSDDGKRNGSDRPGPLPV